MYVLFIYCEKKVMQYNKHAWIYDRRNKFYFVCIVKTKVDKVMASVKKGEKYMVLRSSKTKFHYDTSHNWVI